jgi:hypothetical protein
VAGGLIDGRANHIIAVITVCSQELLVAHYFNLQGKDYDILSVSDRDQAPAPSSIYPRPLYW